MISGDLKINSLEFALIVEAKFGDNHLAFWIHVILAKIQKTRMCFLELNSAVANVKQTRECVINNIVDI